MVIGRHRRVEKRFRTFLGTCTWFYGNPLLQHEFLFCSGACVGAEENRTTQLPAESTRVRLRDHTLPVVVTFASSDAIGRHRTFLKKF